MAAPTGMRGKRRTQVGGAAPWVRSGRSSSYSLLGGPWACGVRNGIDIPSLAQSQRARYTRPAKETVISSALKVTEWHNAYMTNARLESFETLRPKHDPYYGKSWCYRVLYPPQSDRLCRLLAPRVSLQCQGCIEPTGSAGASLAPPSLHL